MPATAAGMPAPQHEVRTGSPPHSGHAARSRAVRCSAGSRMPRSSSSSAASSRTLSAVSHRTTTPTSPMSIPGSAASVCTVMFPSVVSRDRARQRSGRTWSTMRFADTAHRDILRQGDRSAASCRCAERDCGCGWPWFGCRDRARSFPGCWDLPCVVRHPSGRWADRGCGETVTDPAMPAAKPAAVWIALDPG